MKLFDRDEYDQPSAGVVILLGGFVALIISAFIIALVIATNLPEPMQW